MISPTNPEVYNRKHTRINLDLQAFFQILVKGKDEKRIPLTIKTIGRGGLMFISPIPLSIGKELLMRVHYYSRIIDFTAKGVWLEKVEKNKHSLFRSGATFTEISDENRVQIDHILNIHTGYHNPFV